MTIMDSETRVSTETAAAIALLSVSADFGVTQVVDANWGVHGSIRKNVFTGT